MPRQDKLVFSLWHRGSPHRPNGMGGPLDQGAHQTFRALKFVVGSCGLDSVFLIEGCIARDLGVSSLILIRGPPIIELKWTGHLHYCMRCC
jgi:hypothetical protein